QLARTIIKAPFDARVTQRQVSEGQYANRGQPLFSADGVEAAEIEARFPIGRLRPLIASRRQAEEGATTSSPEQRQPGATKLQASVRLRTADHTVEWPARVDRASGMVDPKTQTMGVVVVVDEPYAQAKPGARPPLVRNTFVEVELRKPARGKPLVLPSSALREGKVYLANAENRLEVRKIKPAFVQDGAVAIAKGLEAGERVLIRPPVPAVEGMLLDVIMDEKAAKKLRKQVEGQPKSGSGKSAS
ncbi:MAG: efflux RND transporter periplasmic adaptor subunit, partial [Gammaproteobacteria bacterium]